MSDDVILNLILKLKLIMIRSESNSPGGQGELLDLAGLIAAVEALLYLLHSGVRVLIPGVIDGGGLDVARVSHHVGNGGDQVGVVTVHIGPVLLHRVEVEAGPLTSRLVEDAMRPVGRTASL